MLQLFLTNLSGGQDRGEKSSEGEGQAEEKKYRSRLKQIKSMSKMAPKKAPKKVAAEKSASKSREKAGDEIQAEAQTQTEAKTEPEESRRDTAAGCGACDFASRGSIGQWRAGYHRTAFDGGIARAAAKAENPRHVLMKFATPASPWRRAVAAITGMSTACAEKSPPLRLKSANRR